VCISYRVWPGALDDVLVCRKQKSRPMTVALAFLAVRFSRDGPRPQLRLSFPLLLPLKLARAAALLVISSSALQNYGAKWATPNASQAPVAPADFHCAV
jgi:hypothetical protein